MGLDLFQFSAKSKDMKLTMIRYILVLNIGSLITSLCHDITVQFDSKSG